MTRPLEFPLLADENVHPEVIDGLRERGRDILTVVEAGLKGHPDIDILRAALDAGRVILTHDSDFGSLAIRQGEPWSGIVHVRPGHISPAFVLQILESVDGIGIEVAFPCLLVAARRGSDVRIRLRSTPRAKQGEAEPG